MSVVTTENAEHYRWGEECDGWHLARTPGLSVIQERVPPGGAEVRHYHQRAEQFFYVLTGTATLEVDGQVHTIQPGSGLHIPAGAAHQLRNDQAEDLTFLVISAPPSHGDRVPA